MMLLPKTTRLRSAKHLAWVATLPCSACKGYSGSQAHHIMFAQKRARGMKVSDEFTVPVCIACHAGIHARGDERSWWAARGIDPISIAENLWKRSLAAGRASEIVTKKSVSTTKIVLAHAARPVVTRARHETT